MIARQSQLFIPTLREAPADAEAVSHKLLVRGGYIRQVSTGVWTFLPLGLARAPEGRADHPRGAGRDRRPGDAHAGAHAARALGARPSVITIPELFHLEDRTGPRLHPPVHARGDGHVPRAGDPELPAAPADALPLLDQGSRRAAIARRAPAAARVHHEGRLFVRPRRGRPRRQLSQEGGGVPPDVPACGLEYSAVAGRVGDDGREGVAGLPRAVRLGREHARHVRERRLRGRSRDRAGQFLAYRLLPERPRRRRRRSRPQA